MLKTIIVALFLVSQLSFGAPVLNYTDVFIRGMLVMISFDQLNLKQDK